MPCESKVNFRTGGRCTMCSPTLMLVRGTASSRRREARREGTRYTKMMRENDKRAAAIGALLAPKATFEKRE